MRAAILDEYIIDKHYKRRKIKIAFNPIKEKFEVYNTAIAKNSEWLPDISPIIRGQIKLTKAIRQYLAANPEADEEKVEDAIQNLQQLTKKQIGFIELSHDLDIEVVTEIFIRINSKGVVLSQADFAMSKIAADERYNGATLRKCIDYFCHLAVAPEFYPHIVDFDREFAQTHYFQKMTWLKNENDDLYDPKYTDMLRVAFTSQFNRGRLADLVSLLSGRNFDTRTFEESIAQASFAKLEQGVLNFINETNFKRFIMIIRSAGFITPRLVRSQNALNFAYTLYLKLRAENYNAADIESFVRKWFVFSILTGRYSGSAESQMDFDIKQISKRPFSEYLQSIEEAELSDAFWNAGLVQSLNTSVASSPYFLTFLASQVKSKDKGFLSKEITVNDLITYKGDRHHIFPRQYLKQHGLTRGRYNQIANYVYMQSEVNIKVGKKAPNVYFQTLKEQCDGGELKYGGINSMTELKENLQAHCIPDTIFDMTIENYDDFLVERRRLMAQKMKGYYFSL